jgi:hypothetical protein
MVGPDCLKILRILNKQEVEYIRQMKKTTGEERTFNINGVLVVRESKRRIIEDLVSESQPKKSRFSWLKKFWLF